MQDLVTERFAIALGEGSGLLLDELRDQGDLDLNGLNSSEPGVLKELVRNLFLYCYARALRPGGTEWN